MKKAGNIGFVGKPLIYWVIRGNCERRQMVLSRQVWKNPIKDI